MSYTITAIKPSQVAITHPFTNKEFIDYLDSIRSDKDKKIIKDHASKTINELKKEWLSTPKGKAYIKETRSN